MSLFKTATLNQANVGPLFTTTRPSFDFSTDVSHAHASWLGTQAPALTGKQKTAKKHAKTHENWQNCLRLAASYVSKHRDFLNSQHL
jgi:hypothetical protein